MLDWGCEHEPVLLSLQCRQLARKADEQAALRAADAAAQRRHADAGFLERWQQLTAAQQAEVRASAADFEAQLQRWCQLMAQIELPSLGREDWWNAHERPKRSRMPPRPPRTCAWHRLLQAAAAPRAAATGAWGSQRCAAVAERVAAAQAALPPQHQELLAELSARLAAGSLDPPLAAAAEAVLAAQSQPTLTGGLSWRSRQPSSRPAAWMQSTGPHWRPCGRSCQGRWGRPISVRLGRLQACAVQAAGCPRVQCERFCSRLGVLCCSAFPCQLLVVC